MPRLLRRALFAAVAATSAVGGAGLSTAAAHSHLSPTNRPTALPAENGRVPGDQLIYAGPDCQVARDAAPGLALLFRQASGRDVGLGVADCYRPIDEQVSLFAQNTASGGPCTATPSFYPDGRRRGTSNHGWGKAVDFANAGSTLNFSSPGYRFLSRYAEGAGWVHPDWAGPGLRCAEPWHWEWVGDGGTDGGPVVRADVVSLLSNPAGTGHTIVGGLGKVEVHGTAQHHGGLEQVPLQWVVVDAARTPTSAGYWLLSGDGGVFTFGDARFHGSTGGIALNRPIVGMAPTPSGQGYWLVASDGGIFTFGDAGFHGSLGAIRLNKPIVGMAPTPSGQGYWLVASDGGIFTFGDAGFHGSTGGVALQAPIVAMAATANGGGYWLASDDGGVFTFGNAPFRGAAAGTHPGPFVDIAASASGAYWLVAADGYAFHG